MRWLTARHDPSAVRIQETQATDRGRWMADRIERAAKAIARGCYAELVDKNDVTEAQYVERYWPLFKQAARAAMDELESA